MPSPVVHTARIVAAYRRYLASADSLRYAQQVNAFYTPSTLCKLLRFGNTEMRRATSLALGIASHSAAIEPLGRSLADADRGVRLAADDAFRVTLIRDAAPVHHQQLLQVMHLNDGAEYAAALSPALILIEYDRRYAEAHHQLGVCWAGLGEPEAAEKAFRTCLWYCRFHYVAWQGLASCCLQRGDLHSALRAFERSQMICPDLESSRVQARALRRRLGLSERPQ